MCHFITKMEKIQPFLLPLKNASLSEASALKSITDRVVEISIRLTLPVLVLP